MLCVQRRCLARFYCALHDGAQKALGSVLVQSDLRLLDTVGLLAQRHGQKRLLQRLLAGLLQVLLHCLGEVQIVSSSAVQHTRGSRLLHLRLLLLFERQKTERTLVCCGQHDCRSVGPSEFVALVEVGSVRCERGVEFLL